MEKEIHVNEYYKKDGTHVREHIRHINSDLTFAPEKKEDGWVINEEYKDPLEILFPNLYKYTKTNFGQTPVLKGGISVDAGFPTGGGIGDILGNIGQVLGNAANVGIQLAPIALQMYQAMNSGNRQAVEYLKPQFDIKIKQLDTQVAQMKTNIDNNITKLVNTKNQSEYSKIYEPLQKDWQEYRHVKNIVNRIKAHANNNDFQSVANVLGNFISKSSAGKTITSNPLMQNVITNLKQNSGKILNAKNIDNLLENRANIVIPKYNNAPILPKYFSDLAIRNLAKLANNTLNISRPEARQLMNLSLNLPEDTYSNAEYSMIQPIFNEKLNKYLHNIGTGLQVTENMKGIVFDKSSPISQKLSNFEQLQKDIRRELSKNPDAKYITGLGIDTDKNLQYAIGHYTLINPSIKNGIFKGTLIDIYDFNWEKLAEDFKNLKLYGINNPAYFLQEIYILQKYYSLIPIEFKI